MRVDRVTQLPLFDEGQVEAGHSTGRDIAISVEHESHHFASKRLNQRAGLGPLDEDEPRPLVRGDEWPSDLPKAPRASKRVEEVPPKEPSAAPANTGGDSGDLAARIARLEEDAKSREENLTSALAQAGDKLDLPKGANASRCCSCDGVVTFAPAGHCDCPLGGAETRPAPAGCQAATSTFKGRVPCAANCREIFWGKDKAQEAEKAIASVEAAEVHPSTKTTVTASPPKVADVKIVAETKLAGEDPEAAEAKFASWSDKLDQLEQA